MDFLVRLLDWTVDNIGNVYFVALATLVAASFVLVAAIAAGVLG